MKGQLACLGRSEPGTPNAAGRSYLRSFGLFFLLILVVLSSVADKAEAATDIQSRLDCPTFVEPETRPQLDLSLENLACDPRTVRVLTTMVGNGNQTLEGLSVFGPEIAASDVIVPAATDLLPGTCFLNTCQGSSVFCTTDADCVCTVVTPGTTSLQVVSPTVVPVAFDKSVIEEFVFTDFVEGNTMTSDTCRILVPEPTVPLLQAFAILSVLTVVSVKRRLTKPS